jgi:aminoglycoside phosphotransferase (APT) family kinase protein
MTDARHEAALRRLVQRMEPGGTLLRTWRLTGGVSAEVTAIEVAAAGGQTMTLTVRRHGQVDLARNPRIAHDEFDLLRIARSHGVAAPRPLYVDDSCDLFPTPVLVVEYIDGNTEFAPPDQADYLSQAAEHLARIHCVGDSPELAFLPRLGRGFAERPDHLDVALGEGRIRDALESAGPLARTNSPVLLHGDYWPGNLLWKDGRLVGIVDWEDALVGDLLADLANARLEFLFAFGVDAMNGFTDRYRSHSNVDTADLPFWDLCAALRPCSRMSEWGLDAATERRMRERHERFVSQAFGALPVW